MTTKISFRLIGLMGRNKIKQIIIVTETVYYPPNMHPLYFLLVLVFIFQVAYGQNLIGSSYSGKDMRGDVMHEVLQSGDDSL